uniref:E3 ubiquitin-protein ligase SINA-like protein 1 n=1 Tax=Aegilops tauschii TaxID=37682 RepID=R7WGL1_AEGTA
MARGGKKARVESPAADMTLGEDDLQVKEEEETGAMVGVAAANAAAPRVEIVVEFDKSLLDCPLCSLPLKPPVFQCRAKHAACGPCAANHANKCPACDGAYERDEGADRYILAMLDGKVESCAVPSVEAAMGAGGRYLPVPSDVPAPEGGGIVIRLRIDKEVKVFDCLFVKAECS